MATIRLSEISVERGGAASGGRTRPFALRGLTLTVPHGETLAVLGPSGCGKSTLLRLIAGLESPDSGRVLYGGRDMAGIPPGERGIGYLFQSYALYPHFTARENITSYFFFRRRTPQLDAMREAKLARTSELLDVEIAYLLDRKPAGLSGGEQQRVALGRCITREPALFLLDEPFSNLDAGLRAKYRVHLKMLLREFAITTVYVTHDQQEAALLGDRIALLRMTVGPRHNEGTLEQIGTLQSLYEYPVSLFAAEFLHPQPDLPPINRLAGAALDDALAAYTVGVRPEAVALLPPGAEAAAPALTARVAEVQASALHDYRVATLRLGEALLVAKLAPDDPVETGAEVRLQLRSYHVLDAESGGRVEIPPAARRLLG